MLRNSVYIKQKKGNKNLSDKFLKNMLKKNYNNHLEQVLSKKKFSLEVKNTLLSMLYKIENGYNDYKTVKRNTLEKDEYIHNIINIIDKDCDEISFINKKSKKTETVNKENKKILCYPIDTNILYCLSQMKKRDIIVEYLDFTIEEAVSDVINTGSNMNFVEPLRDFNRIFLEYNYKRHTRF